MSDIRINPVKKQWQYEVILDTYSTFLASAEKTIQLPVVVSTLQLPNDIQLQLRLQRGNVKRSPQQSANELHYEILLNESPNYSIQISAKIDTSDCQPATGMCVLNATYPVEIQAGNPLVLLLINNPQLTRINFAAVAQGVSTTSVKLIIVAHFNDNLAEKQSNVRRHLEQLGSLLSLGQFADCKVISTDGNFYDCHKALLCLKSSVIRTAFESSQMKESQTDQINLNCNAAILDLVLPYFYTGELPTVTADLAVQLYTVSHMYQIEGLQGYLADQLLLKADQLISAANVLEFVEFADVMDLPKLKRFCLQLINRNRSEIVKGPDWKEFRVKQGHLVDELLLI